MTDLLTFEKVIESQIKIVSIDLGIGIDRQDLLPLGSVEVFSWFPLIRVSNKISPWKTPNKCR